MDITFRCYNPLATMCRAMDIARRLGIGFDKLSMRREGVDLFAVDLALDTVEKKLCDNFTARLYLCHDLVRETQDD